MRLVENWKSAWRWFSVQALAVTAAMPIVWAGLPADIKAMIPDGWGLWIFVIVGIGGIAGRILSQSAPAP